MNEVAPKVVVIGAGLSGLTAAYRLSHDFENLEIYEARERVGGRVFTALLNGKPVELGGMNLTDGGEAPHLLKIISEMGLKTQKFVRNLDLACIDNGKKIIFEDELQKHHFEPEATEKKLQEACGQSENMQQVIDTFFEKGTLANKFASTLLQGYEGAPANKLSTSCRDTFYHILLGGLSSNHRRDEKDRYASIEFSVVEGGNQRLADQLASKLSKQLKLNHALEKITKDSRGLYHLKFKNGHQTQANYVILSIPCSTYSNLSIDPKVIPLERQEKIHSVLYGRLSKMYVPLKVAEIESRFFTNWTGFIDFDERLGAVCILPLEEDSLFTKDTIQKKYAKQRESIEQMALISTEPTEIIYAEEKPLYPYKSPIGYSWSSEPYSQGSYSTFRAGREEEYFPTKEYHGYVVKELFAPIENTLFFAGEHTTTSNEIIGTMEAAVESGELVAKMLAAVASMDVKR